MLPVSAMVLYKYFITLVVVFLKPHAANPSRLRTSYTHLSYIIIHALDKEAMHYRERM